MSRPRLETSTEAPDSGLEPTTEDQKRWLTRTEKLPPIPPSDPDFEALFRRRSDTECINRSFEDTLWLRRAHSVGHESPLLTY